MQYTKVTNTDSKEFGRFVVNYIRLKRIFKIWVRFNTKLKTPKE